MAKIRIVNIGTNKVAVVQALAKILQIKLGATKEFVDASYPIEIPETSLVEALQKLKEAGATVEVSEVETVNLAPIELAREEPPYILKFTNKETVRVGGKHVVDITHPIRRKPKHHTVPELIQESILTVLTNESVDGMDKHTFSYHVAVVLSYKIGAIDLCTLMRHRANIPPSTFKAFLHDWEITIE